MLTFENAALAWCILGLALVVVELLTGTFYLLMLGVAAFGAALAAWLGQGFPVQVMVAGVVAIAGAYAVHHYRARNTASQMPPIDLGQPAVFEQWLDAGSRLARVRYRGASWDAQVASGGECAPGMTLYVASLAGNTLTVSADRPRS